MLTLQGMSSALDITAMLLLPMAIVIAAYALAVYIIRLRQMGDTEVRLLDLKVPSEHFSSAFDSHSKLRSCYAMLQALPLVMPS